MSEAEKVVRAWRDSEYFENLSESERQEIPENPAGGLRLALAPQDPEPLRVCNTKTTWIDSCCSTFISNTCSTLLNDCCSGTLINQTCSTFINDCCSTTSDGGCP